MKPRERLEKHGVQNLADRDLLSILLRTGTKGKPVELLAEKVLTDYPLIDLRGAALQELMEIPGIGRIKAIEIKAMIELGKRIHLSKRETVGKITSSSDYGHILSAEMSDLPQEHLVALYLNSRNQIIQKKTIFVGTVNSSIATPREILHEAVKLLAASILVAHNHPSGSVEPSDSDIDFTENLRESCKALGIKFLDHIIVGNLDYFSFREARMFPK